MNYLEAVPDVLTQIPSAPDFVITAAFNRSVRKFCELSGAYRLRVENISVKDGLQRYDLEFYLPNKTTVHKVDSVILLNKRLQPATFKFVSQELGDRMAEQDTPKYFVPETATQVMLWPTPKEDARKGMEAQLVLKPTRNADEVEDWFGEKYYEALIAGTVAEMSRTPNTEFYNPSLFPLMEQYFAGAITEAKKEATGADRAVPRKVRYGGY